MALHLLRCLPIVALACTTMLFATPAFAECPELIENGSFPSSSVEPWTIEAIPPSSLLAISFFQGLRVSIPDPDFGEYIVEVGQAVPIRKGEIYRVSFFIQSPPAGEAHLRVGNAARRTQSYGLSRDLSLIDGTMTGRDWATYAMTFVATETDRRARFVISVANAASYNLFVRLSGISLVQMTGDCFDSASSDEPPPNAGPADHSDAGSADHPDGSVRTPRFAAPGCTFAGDATTRGYASVVFALSLLLGWRSALERRRPGTDRRLLRTRRRAIPVAGSILSLAPRRWRRASARRSFGRQIGLAQSSLLPDRDGGAARAPEPIVEVPPRWPWGRAARRECRPRRA